MFVLTLTKSGKRSQNILSLKLNSKLFCASKRFSRSLVSMLPIVGFFSTIKLNKPVKIVETDQAGFQVSGW